MKVASAAQFLSTSVWNHVVTSSFASLVSDAVALVTTAAGSPAGTARAGTAPTSVGAMSPTATAKTIEDRRLGRMAFPFGVPRSITANLGPRFRAYPRTFG
jgi:hypothetical protein